MVWMIKQTDHRASILPTKKHKKLSQLREDEAGMRRGCKLVNTAKQEPTVVFITVNQARKAGSLP